VRSHTFEQNGIAAFVLYELQDDPQIIAAAARPRTGQLSFEFVGLELRMKRIFGQQFERQLKVRRELGMLAGKTAGGSKAVEGRSSRFTRALCA